jgi:plasmid stabilization system protein ParE
MKFALKKLPPAEVEQFTAARWYDEHEPGLGDRFLDAVEAAIQSLAKTPQIHRIRFGDVRRIAVKKFSFYGVYFVIRDKEVWVISIFHGRRDPRWLRERRSGLD